MLNIKNKYKAFQNSFYPHTSLTAGLNIFEKTFHSRRKRMHKHLHMQINMSTNYKPEFKELGLCSNYNTIKVHPEETLTYSNRS